MTVRSDLMVDRVTGGDHSECSHQICKNYVSFVWMYTDLILSELN